MLFMSTVEAFRAYPPTSLSVRRKRLVLAVLCNTMDVSVAAIADAALNAYCGLEVEEERQIHAERSWSAEELEELAGSYVSGEGDAFTLTVENGTLEHEGKRKSDRTSGRISVAGYGTENLFRHLPDCDP